MFRDYFSKHAADYAIYRPDYPEDLFAYLAHQVAHHQLAWDCGTGNGQAAIALTQYFDHIIATDASEKQIAAALPHQKISYKVSPAEKTDIAEHSVDLITVAQALHWFDLDLFYPEVKRVLKPQGLLAAWCYTLPRIDTKINLIIDRLYWEITKSYWDDKRKLIDDEYQTVLFPFNKIPTPAFQIKKNWDLLYFIGYLNTWSGLKNYIEKENKNPIEELMPEFVSAWGDPISTKAIVWPIHLLLGKQ